MTDMQTAMEEEFKNAEQAEYEYVESIESAGTSISCG